MCNEANNVLKCTLAHKLAKHLQIMPDWFKLVPSSLRDSLFVLFLTTKDVTN